MVAGCTLAACVTPQPQSDDRLDPELRQQRIEALTQFSFRGGLGIWTDEQSISARIRWQQSNDQLDVNLTGPLGIGDMQLVNLSDNAVLKRSGTVVSQGPSVDRVLQRGLGLTAPVPVKELQDWVRGLPGSAKSVVRDAQGKLSSVRFKDEQGTNWQARFLRYSDLDGLAVPSLITASGGPYSVRLVLKDWQLDTDSVVPPRQQSNTRLAIPTR